MKDLEQEPAVQFKCLRDVRIKFLHLSPDLLQCAYASLDPRSTVPKLLKVRSVNLEIVPELDMKASASFDLDL